MLFVVFIVPVCRPPVCLAWQKRQCGFFSRKENVDLRNSVLIGSALGLVGPASVYCDWVI